LAIDDTGINAVLVVILQDVFNYPKSVSAILTNAFMCFNYLFALLGAYTADQYLGVPSVAQ
jgi:dipeptide/tripeptide permease